MGKMILVAGLVLPMAAASRSQGNALNTVRRSMGIAFRFGSR